MASAPGRPTVTVCSPWRLAETGMLRDYHVLPRVADGWTFLYVDHTRIDQHEGAVAFHDARGTIPIPCANLRLLMLGPGTSITHEAIKTLTQHGCVVQWTGEEGVRHYAAGTGETRSARRLYRQARLWASPTGRLMVVRRMYERRFDEPVDPRLTLEQLRGVEGIRVRETYARASRDNGVLWRGRNYKSGQHQAADEINRALSTANSCLYGVAHSAIVAAGYSAALGFIHTGKLLSFVLDVADLYKTEVSIPAAFMAVADGPGELDAKVRRYCRNLFHETRLLTRIVRDIDEILETDGLQMELELADGEPPDRPSRLWDPQGEVDGGTNYGAGLTGETLAVTKPGGSVNKSERAGATRPARAARSKGIRR